MALALESANKVREKVYNALGTQNARAWGRDQVKAFFLHWAKNKSNDDLQFLHIDGTLADDAGGQDHGVDVACKVYLVFIKKPATDTEDAYYAIFDDATNDAGGGTDGRLVIGLLDANQEATATYPDGLSLAAGVVSKSYTDFDGTTDTTAGQAPYGFIVIGAA